MSIQSFTCAITREFFISGKASRKTGWLSVSNIARRKLDMLHFATCLNDLKSPPGNRLEILRGDLKGFWSIRINDQWRIIFKFGSDGPFDVKICDYH
ncbi:type II toxin-antitoxin system RelE/ParE family toxin [Bdellovibrio sp. HCB185ZH]|uniref:type II toxin-antitoxin system RelE/ParE family toxin n=1 Tax=Bdellovibrio sp. HCB185ZH TaxID=3394235 RepID=UPI0039A53FB8